MLAQFYNYLSPGRCIVLQIYELSYNRIFTSCAVLLGDVKSVITILIEFALFVDYWF